MIILIVEPGTGGGGGVNLLRKESILHLLQVFRPHLSGVRCLVKHFATCVQRFVCLFFVLFFILRRMGKNKALAQRFGYYVYLCCQSQAP